MIPVDLEYPAIPNLDFTREEKDWLIRRTDRMSEKEKILFMGAMNLRQPKCMADVIDLAVQLDCFEAVYPAGNRRELGRFVAKHLREEYGEFAHLSKKDVGAIYQKGRSGVFVPINTCEGRGAYVTLESTPSRLYDGTNLDALLAEDYGVRLRLSSPDCPEGVWMKLPDHVEIDGGLPGELAIALDSLDAVDLEECTLQEVQCALPGLEEIADQYSTENLEKLIRDGNNLGFVLAEQWQGAPHGMEQFLAALEYEDCTRLDQALDISQNLDCYDFLPPGTEQAGADQGPEMQATEHGDIRRNGRTFFYEHSQPPEGPELRM